jgi:hypothetical protein
MQTVEQRRQVALASVPSCGGVVDFYDKSAAFAFVLTAILAAFTSLADGVGAWGWATVALPFAIGLWFVRTRVRWARDLRALAGSIEGVVHHGRAAGVAELSWQERNGWGRFDYIEVRRRLVGDGYKTAIEGRVDGNPVLLVLAFERSFDSDGRAASCYVARRTDGRAFEARVRAALESRGLAWDAGRWGVSASSRWLTIEQLAFALSVLTKRDAELFGPGGPLETV